MLHERANNRCRVGRQDLGRLSRGSKGRLSKCGRGGERERRRRERAERVPRERRRVARGDLRKQGLGKAGLSQVGVPGGGKVLGQAVQSLKNVLKAQRRWGSRVGISKKRRRCLGCGRWQLLLLLREKVDSGRRLVSWCLLPERSERGGSEGRVGRSKRKVVLEWRSLVEEGALLAETRTLTEAWTEPKALVEMRTLVKRRRLLAAFLGKQQKVEVHGVLVVAVLK